MAIIFCLRCASPVIDVNNWQAPDSPVIQCYHCGNATALPGFTLGRPVVVPIDAILQVEDAAAADAAEFREIGGPPSDFALRYERVRRRSRTPTSTRAKKAARWSASGCQP